MRVFLFLLQAFRVVKERSNPSQTVPQVLPPLWTKLWAKTAQLHSCPQKKPRLPGCPLWQTAATDLGTQCLLRRKPLSEKTKTGLCTEFANPYYYCYLNREYIEDKREKTRHSPQNGGLGGGFTKNGPSACALDSARARTGTVVFPDTHLPLALTLPALSKHAVWVAASCFWLDASGFGQCTRRRRKTLWTKPAQPPTCPQKIDPDTGCPHCRHTGRRGACTDVAAVQVAAAARKIPVVHRKWQHLLRLLCIHRSLKGTTRGNAALLTAQAVPATPRRSKPCVKRQAGMQGLSTGMAAKQAKDKPAAHPGLCRSLWPGLPCEAGAANPL